jgi:hypothetical protein
MEKHKSKTAFGLECAARARMEDLGLSSPGPTNLLSTSLTCVPGHGKMSSDFLYPFIMMPVADATEGMIGQDAKASSWSSLTCPVT